MGPQQPGADSPVEVRFVRGDEAAFEALFHAHQAEVFRWALAIVRDRGAAEDVTLEAFWRAHRARARFDPSRSFGAWMRRIATNAAIDHVNRSRRQQTTAMPAQTMAARGSDGSATDTRLTAAVARLSPKLRVVVHLALVEEQPYADIARALGISVAAVKVRVFRAVRQLRTELSSKGTDHE